ncbi:MAG: ACP S-malonyltransferase [Saprospiraceae bacterium]|nr:ACP S-malonyltransferase [Saprospiraceae bacterium]
MIAYIFPGQGAQFEGMGKDLYQEDESSKAVFDSADSILGFKLSEIMFEGSAEELKKTEITQPALFVHALASFAKNGGGYQPDAVAGHSLGEFSALVANGTVSFEDGLKLVYQRAQAMQKACNQVPGTMAAILGLDNEVVEAICASIDDVVVAANYNCPGQLVISGTKSGIEKAVANCTEQGARRALILPVGGAFHSPLMAPAQEELALAIDSTVFNSPSCPIYQNVTAKPESDPEQIKANLIAQLTGPVKWTHIMQNMIQDGITSTIEVGGNGKVLSGLFKKVDRKFPTSSI